MIRLNWALVCIDYVIHQYSLAYLGRAVINLPIPQGLGGAKILDAINTTKVHCKHFQPRMDMFVIFS